MTRHYEIFADYFQFYLWDADEKPEPPTDYSDTDVQARIKAAPFAIVVQPVRNMAVPVVLDVTTTAPTLALDAWDHVAEASLELPSGRLEIHECTGGSVDILDVAPGSYRVRALFAGLDTLSDDGLDGEDHYQLVLWPAPNGPVEVLKQFEGA
jgi:hypothetical protein